MNLPCGVFCCVFHHVQANGLGWYPEFNKVRLY